MSENTKKRLPNFSYNEKLILIELVKKFKNIVENKQTDAASVKRKDKCWSEIMNEYNRRTTSIDRNVISLKSCWDNLKKKMRKHYRESRKGKLHLTAGKQSILAVDPVTEAVREIIKSFDSEFTTVNDDTDNNIEQIFVDNTNHIKEDNSNDDNSYMEEYQSDKESDNSSWELNEELTTSATEKNSRKSTSNRNYEKLIQCSKHSNFTSISPAKCNQCLYELTQAKKEFIEVMTKDVEKKSKIELEILNVQLEKERLQVKLLRKQIQKYD